MAVLSNSSTYAIRATLYVAATDPAPGAFVSTRRIAEDLDVPFAFLTKVLQGLTQKGILISQRGPAGGVALARATEAITLLEIVQSAGGDDAFHSCLLGLPHCSDTAPCAMHDPWKVERGRLAALFARTTLADLAGRASATLGGSRRMEARRQAQSRSGRAKRKRP